MREIRRYVQARQRDDSGVAVVEFALILPVLLLIILGILNFGYLFGQKLALNQAVREGARQAVVPGSNNGADVQYLGQIRDVVQNSTGGLVNKSNVVVKVGATGSEATTPSSGNGSLGGCKSLAVGVPLSVLAEYAAPVLIPWPIPGLDSTYALKSRAIFRCEW